MMRRIAAGLLVVTAATGAAAEQKPFKLPAGRLYVFHSVTEEMLKPEDLKAKVLAHMRRPMAESRARADDLMAVCDSDFEREVLRRLLGLGYRVQPQVKVGAYAIDLVVEGYGDRRLAIELDGDPYHGVERWSEDLARQRVAVHLG